MSEQEIVEGNKLIVEFIGYKFIEDGHQYWRLSDKHLLLENELKYHSSWDWLMPVIEKIEHLFETDNTLPLFDINSHFCRFSLGPYEIKEYKQWIYGCYITSPEENKCSTKIDAAWNVCVEFIKWYKSWKEK